MIRILLPLLVVALWSPDGSHALSSIQPPQNPRQEQGLLSRSQALRAGLLTASALIMGPSTVHAADEKTIYNSGKPPKVPGAKPKDKSDVSGTRKDPNFLRSIADCKSQCESKGKPKEDCLSECQDICCTTYEQVSRRYYEEERHWTIRNSNSLLLCQ